MVEAELNRAEVVTTAGQQGADRRLERDEAVSIVSKVVLGALC